MQVKTFLGKDAASVLAQVKAEMGPDAVILASRDVSKGSVRLHEVTAGIERLEVQSEDFFGQNYSANGAGFDVSADGKNQSASFRKRRRQRNWYHYLLYASNAKHKEGNVSTVYKK